MEFSNLVHLNQRWIKFKDRPTGSTLRQSENQNKSKWGSDTKVAKLIHLKVTSSRQ